MVLAGFLLLCSFPRTLDNVVLDSSVTAERSAAPSSSASVSSSTDTSSLSTELLASPEPKVKTDAEVSSAEPVFARAEAWPIQPAKPAFSRPYETRTQKKLWYGLAAAGHSAAAFDAWSTRRAISGGYGTESNPFPCPFAHSGALYAATQVSPAFMDYLGKRMMLSRHQWVRRMWWLPQSAGASLSFAAGVHNVGVVP